MALFYTDSGELALGCATQPFSLAQLTDNYDHPFFIYDWYEIERRLQALRESLRMPADVLYAMKANANPTLMRRMRDSGTGVDVVSAGEIRHALDCGFLPEQIVFSGVGKTAAEIEYAVNLGLQQINVESPQELERVGVIAQRLDKCVPVGLRINPDVDPDTHPYITTGFRENKFGMDTSFLPEIKKIAQIHSQHLKLQGTAIHIGSQLLDISSIDEAIGKTIPVYEDLRKAGHPMQTFDIGGGLGIEYRHDEGDAVFTRISEYGTMVYKHLQHLDCRLLCEPGRILVGPSGVLVCQVQYIKETPFKRFAITDTGMHHLLRPALYQAYHRILPLINKTKAIPLTYDVVGPICESADVIGTEREITPLQQGDFLAIADAGAYGFTMASHYNKHDLPQEWLVINGDAQNISSL